MVKLLIIEQFQLTLWIPENLPESQVTAITKRLEVKTFQADLVATVKQVIGGFPELESVTVELSR